MKINKLDWDSAFFCKKIGELFISDANVTIENYDFDLIVVKQTKDFETKIKGYFPAFKETKIIFEKSLEENKKNSVEIKDTDFEPKNLDFFRILAYESGKKSRFLLDENFGEEKFKKLYDEWIINSLNKKFAKKIFYIENNNTPVAFVTVQQSGNTGKIGLIASNPEFQGKGFGKQLLAYAENYCLENGMNCMEIQTQKENIQACKFYKKMGYKIKEEIIIKHFWNKL